MLRRLFLLSLFFSFVLVQGQTLEVITTLEQSYRQGQEGAITFIISAETLDTAFEGVLFLNVVELDEARNWPQAAHKIFAAAKEAPTVFRVVRSGAELKGGLETELQFRLRERAKPGDYALVIQLYQGSVTDPNRVRGTDRIAMRGFNFRILGN